MLSRISSRETFSSTAGFTLMELLVAMTTGLIVSFALLAIIEVSLKQETRISDQVQSNRIGRTALTNIADGLRSSCTGFGSAAIQAPVSTPVSPLAATGPANLWFITAYGSKSSQNPYVEKVTLHDLNWTATSGELGKLTDYFWNSTNTGNAVPPFDPWTFNSTLSTATAEGKRVLSSSVVPSAAATLYHYFKYDTTSSDTSYGELVEIPSSELPLTASNASSVAKVEVGFKQAPEDGDARNGHTTTFNTAVSLRLSPTESRGEGGECS